METLENARRMVDEALAKIDQLYEHKAAAVAARDGVMLFALQSQIEAAEAAFKKAEDVFFEQGGRYD